MFDFSLLKSRLNMELQPSYSTKEFDLHRVEVLHEMLDFPERQFAVIHVTGSKGKGSTAAMLSCVLEEAGLRVGLYTSPHVRKLEERIQINGVPISRERLNAILEEKIRPALDKMSEIGEDGESVTVFEILTVAAFEYFAEENVDFAVVEVGLGGRTDATNICRPSLCIITNIALEHTAQLGGTVEEIAREKAGIVKEEVPLIVGAMAPEVFERVFPIIHGIATEKHAPDAWAGKQFPVEIGEGIPLGMPGAHQRRNAAIVLKSMELFRRWVSLQNIRNGLKRARLPGRIELVRQNPTVILDAAHSPESMRETVEWIKKTFPQSPKRVVFASAQDKNWRKMLEILQELTPEKLVLTEFLSERTTPTQEIRPFLCQIGWNGEIVEEKKSQDAYRMSIPQENMSTVLLVTGSFFLLREIYDLATEPSVPQQR